jgi:AcrR family transcriptional regulator
LERGDKRCAVIHAALELVAEHGFHGAPMALVAERAGVAAGTIYRYFESKDALIIETFRFLEDRLMAAILQGYPEGGPVRERFLHVARGVLLYLTDSPLEFRFLEQFHNSPYGADHRRDKMLGKGERSIILDLFDEGLREGIVKDLPVLVLFALAFGPLIQICRDAILGFITLDDRLVGDSVEACWDAVKRFPSEK